LQLFSWTKSTKCEKEKDEAITKLQKFLLSSDEFRIKLEKIRNSTDNVEFEIRIRGRIWPQNSNSTKFDGRIWL
jgi:hypothetical protein